MQRRQITPILIPLGLVLLLSGGALAASNLSLNFSVVEEDDFEPLVIEFDLGPSRQAALVEMVIDFNQDGHVNGEEFAIEAYIVRDNEQFEIQGTVHPGIPGDSDPAEGQVSIVRSLAEERFFFGKYVIRVDDGEGMQEQAIDFRQDATGVQISGSVTLDHGSAQSAFVIIEDDSEGASFERLVPAYNGSYSASLPGESTYLVMALRPGRVTLAEQGGGTAVHRGPGDTSPVDLNLTSSDLRITGRVVDEQSQPVPYVLVLAQWAEEEGDDEILLGLSIAQTDENGQYALAVTQGDWAVTVTDPEAQGYVESDGPDLEGLGVTGGSVTAPDLLLSTKVVSLITGRLVREDNGQPLGGLVVEAFVPSEEEFFAEAGTDSEGRFTLGVFEGTWTVEILDTPRLEQLALLAPSPQSYSVSQGQVRDLGDIRLGAPEAQIQIRVVDNTGLPLEGVGLYVNLQTPEEYHWVETEDDGRVTFLVPRTGVYSVGPGYQRYVAPGHEDYEQYKDHKFLISPPGVEIDVAAGEVESVSFTMTYGGLIEGYLRGGGGPVEIGEIRIYPPDAASLFEQKANKWLYPLDARPTGIDYWIPLPPGDYLVQAGSVQDNFGDSFGYAPEFASGKYDLQLADVITVPGVRQKARVDFDLKRGGKIAGTVFLQPPGGSPQPTAGVKVEALDADTLQRIAGTTTAWGGEAGAYQLWLPADRYLLRAKPAQGTSVFPTVYYENASDPAQAQVLALNDYDDLGSIDLHATSIGPVTIGDIDRNGRVEPLDLFSLSTVWHADAATNVTSLLANEDDSDTIDEVDLLLWLDRFRRFNY